MVSSRPKVVIHSDANNLLGSASCHKGVPSSNEMLKQIKLDRKQSRQGFWLIVRAEFA
ncbi:MAG TPA: hypothetical protein VFJ51_01925 [Nitrososphaeraceae archaeon]|nr:hypothetical protein [Nitrososphaeraceae archaeon]